MVGSTKQGERGRKFNADALVLENMQENLIKKKKTQHMWEENKGISELVVILISVGINPYKHFTYM